MTQKTPFDPDSVAAIIAQTLHRMTLDEPKPLEILDEFTLPITETLIKVLIEQPAVDAGSSDAALRSLSEGRVALAAYVGFDFALRCVASVLVSPLADHRADFEAAARLSSFALLDESEGDVRFTDRDSSERFRLRASFAAADLAGSPTHDDGSID